MGERSRGKDLRWDGEGGKGRNGSESGGVKGMNSKGEEGRGNGFGWKGIKEWGKGYG